MRRMSRSMTMGRLSWGGLSETQLSREVPDFFSHVQPDGASVFVVDFFHLFDRIEVADDEGGGERFAGFDGAFGARAEFFDHAAVAPLVAPGSGDDVVIERHAAKPGAACV